MGTSLAPREIKDVFPDYGNWGNNGSGLLVGWNILNDGSGHPTCFSVSVTTVGSATPATDGAKFDGFLTVTGRLTLGTMSGMLRAVNGLVSAVAPIEIPADADAADAVFGVQSGVYLPETPVITAISPSSGYVSGNQPVRITGTNLLSAASVVFGTQRAQWFHATSEEILCLPPPTTTSGALNVTVTNAASPGGEGEADTITFTYLKSTISASPGTQTQLFRTTSPFSNPGSYTTGPMAIGADALIWFPAVVINGSIGLTGPNSIVSNFNTSGTLAVIANQQTYYFPGYTHAQHGICVGSDGAIWTYDHHGTISRINSLNSGEAYSVSSYPLRQSGSGGGGSPPCMITGPDGWLWLFGALTSGTTGAVWRVNPRSPLEQTKWLYPGLSFFIAVIGPNGNFFVEEENTPGIVEMDINGELVGSVVPVTGFPNQLCLGGDLNLWMTTFTPQLVRINPSDLTVQSYTNLPSSGAPGICAGADGNIWVAGDNSGNKTDSLLLKINVSGTIIDTYTIVGSVGGSASSHPGGANSVQAGPDGKAYVTIDQDPSASPIVSGYAEKIV